MSQHRQHAYPALDGMRGVAAIAVMLHHFPPLRQPALFHNGLLAVDVFFVMSGFVIAGVYDTRLAGGLGTRRFMLVRYVRLWPMLALGVAAGLAQALLVPVPPKDLPLAAAGRIACAGFGLAILPCPLPSPWLFPTDMPEWSLFYELLANLLYALAFVPLLKEGRMMIAVIAPAGAVLAIGILHHRGASFGGGLHSMPFELSRVTFSFFLGLLLQRTQPLWAPRLPRLSPWLVYGLLLAVLAAPTPHALDTAVHMAVVLVASPLLIGLGAVAAPQGRWMGASALLGAMSYPLYCLHQPIMFAARGLIERAGTVSPGMDLMLALAIVAVCLALPSTYETPARRALVALLDRSLRLGPPSPAGGRSAGDSAGAG